MAVPPPRPVGSEGRPGGAGAPVPFGGQLLPLRRQTVADLLDGAVRTFRAVVGPATLIVLLVIGPLQLLTNLVISQVAPGFVGGGLTGLFDLDVMMSTETNTALALTNLASFFLGYLLSLVASAAVVALVLARDRGEQAQAVGSLRAAVSVLVPTLVASFILGVLGIAVFVGVMIVSIVVVLIPILGLIVFVLVLMPLYLVGAAAFFAMTSLVVPVAVVERAGPLTTLSRTIRVFTRQPIRILWVTILIGIVAVIVTVGLQLPFLLASEFAPAGGWAIETFGEVAAQIVTVPVTASAALLIYLDTRVRSEAVDLRLRVRDLAAP